MDFFPLMQVTHDLNGNSHILKCSSKRRFTIYLFNTPYLITTFGNQTPTHNPFKQQNMKKTSVAKNTKLITIQCSLKRIGKVLKQALSSLKTRI